MKLRRKFDRFNAMIYLDNNATTQIAPEVFEAMKPYLTEFYGNPSSSHTFGRNVRNAVNIAREQVSGLLNAKHADEIYFTSGGTESDNWAILGTLEANPIKKHIVTTQVEHEAVRKLCDKLETQGYEISRVGVDEKGLLNLDELKAFLRKDTAIVSVMLANNETGVIFPIKEVSEIIKTNSDAVFHVDGVNAVGKIPCDMQELSVDLFSISGHKFHAPKGIGALYVRNGINLPSMFIGGGQENTKRAGTEAVHQIAAIGAAADFVKDFSKIETVRKLRDKFENFVLQNTANTQLNGDRTQRLPNTSSISFVGLEGETILAMLNDIGVCVSTGSACNAENHVSSAVLRAMETPYEVAKGTIRFSFGRFNTENEVDFLIEKLPIIMSNLKKMSL
jgi:cysteine desulfurase